MHSKKRFRPILVFFFFLSFYFPVMS